MTHELTLNQQEEEEVKKKKLIILATEIKQEGREESEEDKSDSEIALLARRIRDFMKKKRIAPRKKLVDRNKGKKGRITCHYYKKEGHKDRLSKT